jgi:AcrR family transcriptional regulator
MARTGRRPGESGTREAILRAAAQSFSRHGYDGTTIRAVAREAGVDPALVHHYFGTKAALFTATQSLPVDPDRVLDAVLDGPLEGLGERLAWGFLAVWEAADPSPAAALVRSAATNEEVAALLRGFIEREIVSRLAARLDVPDAAERAELAAAQLVGTAMLRLIVRVEPLASMPQEELVARLAPVLQRHLTG